MRAKSVLLLVLALGCGLVASIGITQVMAKRDSGAPASDGDTQQIFVALADIPTNDLITAEMLKLEEWPKDKVPEGALTKVEEVEGRRPRTKIWQGEVIMENKLAVGMVGAAEEIPVGLRVVSVTVTKESGISDLIRPGDRVDVLLYLKQCPGTVCETGVRTLFQDVKVFAINDVYNLEGTEGQNSINAKTVSLLVTPKQAEKFTLATELGDIRLTLRSHDDKDPVELVGTFAKELTEGEVSSRDREELERERPDTPPSDDLDGFLTMLNSQGAQTVSPPALPAEPNSWTIQLIQGSEVSEVVLEEMDESPKARGPNARPSGFNFWKAISPIRSGSLDVAPSEPDADDRAEDGEKEGEGKKAKEGDAAQNEEVAPQHD
ncbi:MAG TPA: Flp pilus assembly protein CpaB [Thermoguttaceae bacterium]|nr:Flp pilus assembly protein CpaB [Thermoguttaceae bacterium]